MWWVCWCCMHPLERSHRCCVWLGVVVWMLVSACAYLCVCAWMLCLRICVCSMHVFVCQCLCACMLSSIFQGLLYSRVFVWVCMHVLTVLTLQWLVRLERRIHGTEAAGRVTQQVWEWGGDRCCRRLPSPLEHWGKLVRYGKLIGDRKLVLVGYRWQVCEGVCMREGVGVCVWGRGIGMSPHAETKQVTTQCIHIRTSKRSWKFAIPCDYVDTGTLRWLAHI